MISSANATTKEQELISFYETILHQVNAIIVVHEFSDKLKPIWLNDATRRITGFTPEEFIKMGEDGASFTLHPDDQEVLKDFAELFTSTDKEFYHGVQRILRKSGEWFWIYVNIKVIERQPNRLPKKVVVIAVELDEQLNSANQFQSLLKENLRLKNELELQKLTTKQREILSLIGQGQTDREISEKLILSIHTIKTHRKNILRNLGLKNTAQLSHFATECGIA